MTESVISVENLGKKYLIRHQHERERYTALRDVLARQAVAPFRWLRQKLAARAAFPVSSASSSQPSDASARRLARGAARLSPSVSREEFWALKDVSFDVKPGEVVGIIGRNGAGKSTLLKILSRITEPTTGRARIKGRVGSLLEVGTGFHPELTGRENVFLNGAILGMTRTEIHRKFDEIVAFAEVERFLDTPVKRYSSGMYVRLAFAVAAHLEPEILVVDEVLAVGDAVFQKRCLGKMREVSRSQGRTVLFVSHNMTAIRALCSSGIVLNNGALIFNGTADAAVQAYQSHAVHPASDTWVRPGSLPRGKLCFETARANLAGHQPQLELIVEASLRSLEKHKPAFVAVDVCDALGASVMQALPRLEGFIDCRQPCHDLVIRITLPPMIPGNYGLVLWAGPHNTETLDEIRGVAAFEVTHSPNPERSFPHSPDHGHIVPHSTVAIRSSGSEPA